MDLELRGLMPQCAGMCVSYAAGPTESLWAATAASGQPLLLIFFVHLITARGLSTQHLSVSHSARNMYTRL